jgi:hypothetical protein
MNPSNSQPAVGQIIEISWADRWQVYRRLQELKIPCQCGPNQPLSYQINDVAAAIQVWSVVKQVTAPRRDLASWLELCWTMQD